MNSEQLTQYVKEVVDKAIKEGDELKEMWKDPNKAAQIRTKLDIMSNDQDALKQLNNAMRIALEMDKRVDKLNKQPNNILNQGGG